MYLLFKNIDDKLGSRYKTIETNIRAKSNSFYESLLALLEGLAKVIVKNEGIIIESEFDTLIGILKVDRFAKYCSDIINVSKEEYSNLFRIAKIVNNHKHDAEAKIDLKTVLEFLNITFNFAKSYYLKLYGECKFSFSDHEIINLYGQIEKENEQLIIEKKKLEESLLSESNKSNLLESDLKKVLEIKNQEASKLIQKESEVKSAQKENDLLKSQINELKDIKLTSMEEKVGAILNALKVQTKALQEMTSQLSYNAELQLQSIAATKASGKPTIRTDPGGIYKPPYKANFTDYERYLLKNDYIKQAQSYAFNILKEYFSNSKKGEENKSLLNYKISYENDSVIVSYMVDKNSKVLSKNLNENTFQLWFRTFKRVNPNNQISTEEEMIESLVTMLTTEACTSTPSDKLLEQFYINNRKFNMSFKS